MRHPRWGVILLGVAALAASGDYLAENRRLLARWRADPEHYARLRRDLLTFHALPPDSQERLREIDHDMHQGSAAQQAKRWAVLDRYAGWLEKLAPEERRRVGEASGDARLRVVKEIKDRQWVERLPAKVRDDLRLLKSEERDARVKQMREEDRKRRRLWQGKDGSPMRPAKLADFSKDVQDYVGAMMLRLGEPERERLRQAEGKWPALARTILELSESHPALPPLKSGPVAEWKDLPPDVVKMFDAVQEFRVKQFRRAVPTGWPRFAEEVTKFLRSARQNPPPLGASRLSEMPAEVQAVIKGRLVKNQLVKLEGQWPEYPRSLLRLARGSGVVLPGMSLPGPAELWDAAQLAGDVPDSVLMRFALHEVGPEERARWRLSAADPMGSREKVLKEYLRRQRKEAVMGAAE